MHQMIMLKIAHYKNSWMKQSLKNSTIMLSQSNL